MADGSSASEPAETFSTNEMFKAIQAKAENDHSDNPLMVCLGYAIHPNNYWRLKWDLFMFVLVLYSSVVAPYDAAFVDTEIAELESRSRIFTWAVIIDICFVSDMVLSFFTGFDKGYEVVMEKSKIVKNYLFGWFFIDFVATMDWGLVAEVFAGNSDSPYIGLMRMLKVLRLARASRLIAKLTAGFTLNSGFLEAFKFFMYVAIVAHIMACFFYLWPTLFHCEEDASLTADGNAYFENSCVQGSWRQGYGLDSNPQLQGSNAGCSGDREAVPETPAACTGSGRNITCVVNATTNAACSDDSDPECIFSAAVAEQPALTCELGPRWDTAWCNGQTATELKDLFTADGEGLSTDGFCCSSRSNTSAEGCVFTPSWTAGRKYIDALYWSVTTMTTIGYGDRGPGSHFHEILFVIFCEVFGLGFFALLIESVNSVNEVMGHADAEANETKNGLVQFLRQNNLSQDLTAQCVKFLNFYYGSLSGNAFDEDDERFAPLSPALKAQIKIMLYKPLLKNVSLFGWNPLDAEEKAMVERLFHKIDTDKGGELDREEIGALLQETGLQLSSEQVDFCFAEMNSEGGGEINLSEFRHWWFLKKNQRPPMIQCPETFLDAMAQHMQSNAFDVGEMVVAPGEYGTRLLIVLAGEVTIMKGNLHLEDDQRDKSDDQLVRSSDKEPVVGIAATLPDDTFRSLSFKDQDETKAWAAMSLTYVDTASIARTSLLECFNGEWSEGLDHMQKICEIHYEDHGVDAAATPAVEEDSHEQRVVDAICASLFDRLAEIENSFDAKLDEVLEFIAETGEQSS